MLSENIIAFARETLGTPFAHQGRICGVALDCAGVAAYIASRLGVDFTDRMGYGRIPMDGILESVMESQPCLMRVFDKRPGDIMLLRYGKDPQHVVIYTGETIIHAFEPSGRVVENRLDDRAHGRITHIYRFKDVAGA